MEMNQDSIPALTINPEYESMAEETTDKQTKQYIKEQIGQANLLISQIEMRNETLLKVANVLLEQQSDYFLKGPKFLKPLTQKEVAERIGVHGDHHAWRSVPDKNPDADQRARRGGNG